MTSRTKVSVIVPAYNEENGIEAVLRRLLRVSQNLPGSEIIVVDDGSTDDTAKRVARFNPVRLVRHGINQGKGAAISTGLKNSKGDIIVIQDADTEYPPEDIFRLLEPILAGRADVVFGSRFKGECLSMCFSHFVGNKILSVATSLLYGASVSDVMTGHKAFSRRAIESYELSEKGFAVEIEIASKCLKNRCRFAEVPIRYSYRRHDISKISYLDGFRALWKLVLGRLSG
ncbi:MAG: glycosyltransferase family 2 protein [Candidatus Bathyarchaeota archaeon]|nr:glycosyltransferase family 2 protein [Candidatus Bathyarchaeota archaeon]